MAGFEVDDNVKFVSQATRKTRRMRAHYRTQAGVRGRAKHRTQYFTARGTPLMARPVRLFDEVIQTPYEGHTTSYRPWVERARRRARNKRARASRKRNRT